MADQSNTHAPCVVQRAGHQLAHMYRLPTHIRDHILDYMSFSRVAAPPPPPAGNPLLAFIPPANGNSPFNDLPHEIREKILMKLLPSSNAVVHPGCLDHAHHPATIAMLGHLDGKRKRKTPSSNFVSDLMTVDRALARTLRTIFYHQRVFVVHLHEGLGDEGGVEFQNAGRQPLHFMDHKQDPRFRKFEEDNEFGFKSVRKAVIQIRQGFVRDNRRLIALNTYYSNLALARLLEKKSDTRKDRITCIEIQFPAGKLKDYWWDPVKKQPVTSFDQNLSNIELALFPWFQLSGCHNVQITLPDGVDSHAPTVKFAGLVETSMKQTEVDAARLLDFDRFEYTMECTRDAWEEYAFSQAYGGSNNNNGPGKLTAEDMMEEPSLYDGDDDGKNPHASKPKPSHLIHLNLDDPAEFDPYARQLNEQEDEEDRQREFAIAASLTQQGWEDTQQHTRAEYDFSGNRSFFEGGEAYSFAGHPAPLSAYLKASPPPLITSVPETHTGNTSELEWEQIALEWEEIALEQEAEQEARRGSGFATGGSTSWPASVNLSTGDGQHDFPYVVSDAPQMSSQDVSTSNVVDTNHLQYPFPDAADGSSTAPVSLAHQTPQVPYTSELIMVPGVIDFHNGRSTPQQIPRLDKRPWHHVDPVPWSPVDAEMDFVNMCARPGGAPFPWQLALLSVGFEGRRKAHVKRRRTEREASEDG